MKINSNESHQLLNYDLICGLFIYYFFYFTSSTTHLTFHRKERRKKKIVYINWAIEHESNKQTKTIGNEMKTFWLF